MARARRHIPFAGWAVVACAAAAGAPFATDFIPSIGHAAPLAASKPAAMPICSGGKRVTCIVDGDTIWVNGEKIRLEGFNAPEMKGLCTRESQLAVRARDHLQRMLSGKSFTIDRDGEDKYGRTLATIRVDGRDVGDDLIGAGLSHVWRGHKESWCSL